MNAPDDHIVNDSLNGHGKIAAQREPRFELFQHSISVSAHNERWLSQDEGVGSRGRAGLASYFEIPFVYRKLILGSLLASMLAAWLAILVWPRAYESEAKMMILVGRESVGLDPTATTGETLTLQRTQEEEVNSVLEVLSSRAVAKLVVEDLGEDAILAGVLPSTSSTASFIARSASFVKDTVRNLIDTGIWMTGVRDKISNGEMALLKVQKTVRIQSPKKSTVISVKGEAKSPKMAQALVKSVTENFMNVYLKVSHTTGSQDFFVSQVKDGEKQLNALVDERSNYLQENKIVSINDNRQLLTAQLAAVDSELNAARSHLSQALAEIRDLSARVAAAEDEIVANKTEQSDTTWSGMRQRVYELQLKEKELAATFTEGHSKLVQVREQLEGAQSILQELQKGRVDQSRTPNPVKLRLVEELQKQETLVVGLRSAISVKEDQRRDLDGQSKTLLDQELHIKQLDREIAVRESSLISLREKLEQARVMDQLQMKQISNVNIFQDASYIERAANPNKPVLAIGIVSLGLLSGFGLAFLREATSSRLRTVSHVESAMGTPVLMSIPFSHETSDLLRFLSNPRRCDTGNNRLRDSCKSILSDVMLSRSHATSAGVRGKSLGVLSVNEGCGASTIAAALALTASEDGGLRTTLIDTDMKTQTLSRAFGRNGSHGRSELIRYGANASGDQQVVAGTQLNVVSGCVPFTSEDFESTDKVVTPTLLEFQHDYDLVIVDLPPASRLDQATSIARNLDLIVLVVESGITDTLQVQRVMRRLEAADAQVLGVVLNKVHYPMPQWLRSIVA